MLVAQKKRKENVSEYILYLYQVESLIRAFNLDMDLINQNLVSSYHADKATRHEISKWYRNLVVMMQKEGKQEKGHLQFLTNLINDLNDFHFEMTTTGKNSEYISAFNPAKELIYELKQKNQSAANDVQVALDGIYGYLLLKLSDKEVSAQTRDAVEKISSWLSLLSKLFRSFESGEIENTQI